MSFDMSIPGPRWVETEEEAHAWAQHFLKTHDVRGSLGLDSETTGLDKKNDMVIIWSISDGASRLCLDKKYLPIFKEPLLENPRINFDLTNAKFDMHMFANTGIELWKAGEIRDTLVMSWLHNENNQGMHGLKESVRSQFGRVTPEFSDVFGKVPPKRVNEFGTQTTKTVGQLIREAVADPARFISVVDYASLDAYNSTMLRERFDSLLDQVQTVHRQTLKGYFYSVEVPFTKLLWQLERRGITVDRDYLMKLKGPMEQRMNAIARDFVNVTGKPVNLKAHRDVRWFFLDFLQKTSWKETKGGKSGIKSASVDAEVLEDWAGEGDQWANKCLEFRGISKIEGTYVTGLEKWIDHNHRIHTSLNQIGTVTGRLSSSEPNLQNVPRPDEDEFKIRQAFIPCEGHTLIVADYEQLEMRLMAHFSGDPKMIGAIMDGMDLHCYTTSEMEGVPYSEVLAAKKEKVKENLTPRQHELLLKRQNNKSTGFGIIYGIGGPKLAAKLTRETKTLVTDEQGIMLINKWLNVFPEVRNYIEKTKQNIWNYGCVQVITGRFRRFGDITSMSKRDRSQAERQGVNAIIQGTAAEIAKYSMLLAHNDSVLTRLGAKMLLQVHDELIFEVPSDPEVVEAAKARVKEIMEHPFPGFELKVPIPASVGSGPNWAAAK